MKKRYKLTKALFSISFISLLLFCLSRIYPSVAAFASVLSVRVRDFLFLVSSLVRPSLFEIAVYTSPILVFLLVRFVFRGGEKMRARFFLAISLISLLPTLYILTLGMPSDISLSRADDGNVTTAELVSAAEILAERVNSSADPDPGELPLGEISEKVEAAFRRAIDYSGRMPVPKKFIFPSFFDALGSLAVYSFFTGEININTNAPSYTLPFTVAHEMAHAVGISDEGTSNFAAYLVLAECDEPALSYSGALCALEYILADIKGQDRGAYEKIYDGLCESAKKDIDSYGRYLKKHSGTKIYKTAKRLNATTVDLLGTGGKRSYSDVSLYVTNYLLSA